MLALDIDPFAREAAELNAALNGVTLAIASEDRIGRPVEADVLLAGDVFYDQGFAARLAPWFDALPPAASRCWSAIPAAPTCRRRASSGWPSTRSR